MKKIEKGIGFLMVAVVILTIVIFFASIMLGHATNFEFFFGFQDIPELGNNIASSNAVL